jgi:membrane associated rhomboid family serine protease
MRSLSASGIRVTEALIVINVLVFIVEVGTGTSLGGSQAGTLVTKAALSGPAIAHQHQYYRLVTSGFLHYSLLHIAFNMFFLYIMGPMLEPAIGRVNFLAVYFVSLLAGSFGALAFTPDALIAGASGACFGVFGALMVVAWDRGISIWRSGLGPTLLINIVFSLSVAGISIGGHLGGFIGGGLAGWVILQLGEKRRMQGAALAGCLLIAAISVAGAIAVASSHGLAAGGVGFGG